MARTSLIDPLPWGEGVVASAVAQEMVDAPDGEKYGALSITVHGTGFRTATFVGGPRVLVDGRVLEQDAMPVGVWNPDDGGGVLVADDDGKMRFRMIGKHHQVSADVGFDVYIFEHIEE